MDQKILKTGNSLAVSIPSDFVKVLGLRAGLTVKVRVDQPSARLIVTFENTGQLPLLLKK